MGIVVVPSVFYHYLVVAYKSTPWLMIQVHGAAKSRAVEPGCWPLASAATVLELTLGDLNVINA